MRIVYKRAKSHNTHATWSMGGVMTVRVSEHVTPSRPCFVPWPVVGSGYSGPV